MTQNLLLYVEHINEQYIEYGYGKAVNMPNNTSEGQRIGGRMYPHQRETNDLVPIIGCDLPGIEGHKKRHDSSNTKSSPCVYGNKSALRLRLNQQSTTLLQL